MWPHPLTPACVGVISVQKKSHRVLDQKLKSKLHARATLAASGSPANCNGHTIGDFVVVKLQVIIGCTSHHCLAELHWKFPCVGSRLLVGNKRGASQSYTLTRLRTACLVARKESKGGDVGCPRKHTRPDRQQARKGSMLRPTPWAIHLARSKLHSHSLRAAGRTSRTYSSCTESTYLHEK